MEQSAIVPRV